MLPSLPLPTPISVQLSRTDADQCWESTIGSPAVNSTTRFRGPSD